MKLEWKSYVKTLVIGIKLKLNLLVRPEFRALIINQILKGLNQ